MTQASPVDQIFAAVEQKFGFVPNLFKEMADSPAALQVYLGGQQALAQGATLSPPEIQAVQLAVSTANGCAYCQAAHTKGGLAAGLSAEDVEAIKSGGLPQDPRLQALVRAARLVLDKRGWLDPQEVQALADQGIPRGQLFDIVAIIGLKTISNYVNHIAHTEIDPQFA